MITEDYVSFETARLLKDKGFNEKVICYYDDGGSLNLNKFVEFQCCNQGSVSSVFAAPTYQKAMKWLREVHNIVINIGWGEVFEDKFQWWCIILNYKDGSILRESEYYTTYVKACEEAIKYCLNNLI